MALLLYAFAPVIVIIFYIYVKDKYEKEPKRIMLLCFLLGGIVSIIITTILYMFFDLFLALNNKYSVIEQFVRAFFIVAFTEEFSKYVIVRYYAQPRRDFNEKFDGIVYAVMVSMGFAAVENIFYVAEGGAQTALLRAFTAVPAHATFGILMGYFMGMAKFSKNRAKLNLLGLLLAIIFHGAYDFFLFINFIPGISIGAFASLIIGIVLSRKAIKRHQVNSKFNIK
ncbi:MAG: PrsW family intramembrane metalloprotease [Flavobacteriaceae bacterium]|nr:PrsW family intramembrane metalloprotease [Bacteroidia bacterium]NND26247.1 PrsW family intramembrane metalloprotease [Flavobacteriaceae bacterium]MBT8279125.1 PrsW family intramembrane metalloprotease [Bacteroidia bacterium]NNK61067.1 PrsW family intramembrane metalloprotease [Flavobacteriaceae bacterium]NNL33300.1 PrsW family intramembrane metalloprotease [Flavobacteriaceae bacterium]